jgi:protein-tyrosine phosphatase
MTTDAMTALRSAGGGARFRILFVCTGNICRSPFMERLMRARLETAFGERAQRIKLGSAGTAAMVGAPMAEPAAALLVKYGGDPSGFVARDLKRMHVQTADLILTATRDHRAAVVTTLPRAAGKTATLREFARLLDGVGVGQIGTAEPDPADQLRALAFAAFKQRGVVPAVDPAGDDIPDPYGEPDEIYRLAAKLINEALAVPLALLSG